MTPPARVAAAIEILDRILAGEAAEKIVTNWGRSNRFAGSGDRAAIRDLVFGALRCKRSFAFVGGAETGRALMIGWVRGADLDPTLFFTGEKYAPDVLSEAEAGIRDLSQAPRAVRLDCQDWVLEHFDASLGKDADEVLEILQSRAPVFLRVNLKKSDLEQVAELLAADDILTAPNKLASTALEVTKNPRRAAQSSAYLEGLIEFQDVASQAVVEYLPLQDGQNVLDYCAGGGGKSLAMAARSDLKISAYDTDIKRMKDLPARVDRAGSDISIIDETELAGQKFDLVLCDVPCSGNGAWRRTPDAKWELTPDRLAELCQTQADILDNSRKFVSKNGVLAYVTCSMFTQENSAQVDAFLARNTNWQCNKRQQLSPLDGGDGFFVALLTRV